MRICVPFSGSFERAYINFGREIGGGILMDKRLEKQLAFSLEIDKVKNIFRQTH